MLCNLMNSRLAAVNGNRTFKDCTSSRSKEPRDMFLAFKTIWIRI
jgi:hypothetical protein